MDKIRGLKVTNNRIEREVVEGFERNKQFIQDLIVMLDLSEVYTVDSLKDDITNLYIEEFITEE